MKTSIHFTATVAAVVVAIGTTSIAVASRADDIRVGRPTITRVRDDHEDERGAASRCLAPAPAPPASPNVAGDMAQTITVTIERTTLLRVDRRNRITAAATNTGCHPRNGDRVYVISPSGTYTEVSDVDLDDIDWKGSFRTIGGFERQSGRARLNDRDH